MGSKYKGMKCGGSNKVLYCVGFLLFCLMLVRTDLLQYPNYNQVTSCSTRTAVPEETPLPVAPQVVAGSVNSFTGANFTTERFMTLQKTFGPLRFAHLDLAPGKCSSFSMALGRKSAGITVNDNIWEDVYHKPGFRWEYPAQEGFVVDAIMEECNVEQGKIPLVLDAGANMGYFSLAAAACGCHAIAYEPNPKCQEFIAASQVLNGFGSAITRRVVAVTDVSGPVGFGGWSTDKHAKSHEFEGVKLDDDVQNFLTSHFFLYLKVDIQGSEQDALRGAAGILGKHLVRYVAIEAQLMSAKASSQDAFQQMCDHGYTCFDVENSAALIQCSEPLDVYRETLQCGGKCERYLVCAHDQGALDKLRHRSDSA